MKSKETTRRNSLYKNKTKIQLKLAKALSSTLDIDKRISLIAKEISHVFDVERCNIFLVNEKKTHLIPQASTSEKLSQLWQETPIDLKSNSTTAKVVRSGKVEMIENASKVPGAYRKLVKRFNIKSSLYVPMKFKGETIGVIVIDDTKKYRVFSDDEIGFASMLASQAAVSLENAKLYEEINRERLNLKNIQNSIPDGIIIYNKDERIISLNKAAREIFKFKKDPVGRFRSEVLFGEKGNYLDGKLETTFNTSQAFQEAISFGKNPQIISVLHRGRKRYYHNVLFSPQFDKDGQVDSVIATIRDISKIIQQENKIKEQLKREAQEKERWEAVFNNVDEGIIILGRNRQIKKVNPGFEILTGLRAEEVIGKFCWQANPAYNSKGEKICDTSCPIKKLEETREAIPYFEHKIKTNYGKETWTGSSFSPLKDSQGKIKGTIHVIRDITKLKELDKTKSEFVSIASHELRTPLTVINGYLSLLLSGDLGKISPNHQIIFNKIYSDTQRLTRLVEDLLNVARIEEGRLKLNPEKVEMAQLVKDTVEEYKIYAESKKISLNFIVPKNKNTQVFIDKNKIKQVLTNLIDNAIKYTPEKGKVKVKITEEDRLIAITIEDNGIGISKQALPSLFTKFQQVSGSYIKENKGTGLGLFIVKGLVELHGGNIDVKSTYGQGSTFRFTLPKTA
ncbi:MAG: ATP-binding protein [Patescibacteria group bacterium]|nr:ATP-binding protein [Patescibacteria group bacterium]